MIIKLSAKQECILRVLQASLLGGCILFLLFLVWFVGGAASPQCLSWSIVVTLVIAVQIPGLVWSYKAIYKRLKNELQNSKQKGV